MVFSITDLSKRLRSGDMAILACLYELGHLLSIENTSVILDITRTDVVREALAIATEIELYFRTSSCASKLLTWHYAGTHGMHQHCWLIT